MTDMNKKPDSKGLTQDMVQKFEFDPRLEFSDGSDKIGEARQHLVETPEDAMPELVKAYENAFRGVGLPTNHSQALILANQDWQAVVSAKRAAAKEGKESSFGLSA